MVFLFYVLIHALTLKIGSNPPTPAYQQFTIPLFQYPPDSKHFPCGVNPKPGLRARILYIPAVQGRKRAAFASRGFRIFVKLDSYISYFVI